MDELEAEIIKAQPQASRIGFDNLLEDIFGLNIRSFKTIWTLLKAPAIYFQAARDGDWMGRFTPSFRIWFGLFALFAALRFIYAGENSHFISEYVAVLEQSGINDDPDSHFKLDYRGYAAGTLKWTFAFLPFVLLLFYSALAFVFRSFPEPTTFVLRLRYIFGTVVPSTALIVITTFTMLIPMSMQQLMVYSIVLAIMTFGLDWVTAYRGTFARSEKGSDAGLSLVFVILLQVTYYTGMIVASVAAAIFVMGANMKHIPHDAPAPAEQILQGSESDDASEPGQTSPSEDGQPQ